MNNITFYTRAAVLLVVDLHIKALVAGAKRLDRIAERKSRAAEDQVTVVAWAQRDLANKRAEARDADVASNQEWQRVNAEISKLPRF